MARFLDNLAARAHTRSTLQAACGVNYDIFRRYLAFLQERGYIAFEGHGVAATIRLTAAGSRVRGELLALIARFLEPAPQPSGAAPIEDRSSSSTS